MKKLFTIIAILAIPVALFAQDEPKKKVPACVAARGEVDFPEESSYSSTPTTTTTKQAPIKKEANKKALKKKTLKKTNKKAPAKKSK